MKLVEIASQLEVPAGTVRRWKSTYHWDGEHQSEQEKAFLIASIQVRIAKEKEEAKKVKAKARKKGR